MPGRCLLRASAFAARSCRSCIRARQPRIVARGCPSSAACAASLHGTQQRLRFTHGPATSSGVSGGVRLGVRQAHGGQERECHDRQRQRYDRDDRTWCDNVERQAAAHAGLAHPAHHQNPRWLVRSHALGRAFWRLGTLQRPGICKQVPTTSASNVACRPVNRARVGFGVSVPQSNMCFSLNQMTGATAEIQLADTPKYRSIRLMTVTPTHSSVPNADLSIMQNWSVADSASVGGGVANKSFRYSDAMVINLQHPPAPLHGLC